MTFTLIDVILIVFVVIFIVTGYVLGFIHTLGSFVGAIAGIVVASRLAPLAGEPLANLLHTSSSITTIIMFVIIYLVVSRLVGFLFGMAEKSFGLMKMIPFVKPIDHLLGAVFGFLEGVLAVAAFVYFAGALLPVDWIQKLMDSSQVGSWLLSIFDTIKGLVPQIIQDKVAEALMIVE